MTDVAENPQSDTDMLPTCPTVMFNGKACDRPIHPAPAHDNVPVCLMHSRDPNKSDAAFQKEFEAILKDAENKIASGDKDVFADFAKFVFPTANYQRREFKVQCLFQQAAFRQVANFSFASFVQAPFFIETTFAEDASFLAAKFTQDANFFGAKFMQKANFIQAEFAQDAGFSNTLFAREADFRRTKFLESAEFRGTEFRGEKSKDAEFQAAMLGDNKRLPGPIFSWAEFSHPEQIDFFYTYLGQALLYKCDVSQVKFSSVTWGEHKGSGKRMLFEEVVDLSHDAAHDLKPQSDSSDDRDYGLIEETYHQLTKNYDDRRDYRIAGDFHYGEMEMKRLHAHRQSRVVRWLHRHLGLVALYKYASHYGESYVRPLFMLAAVLLLFSLVLPFAGFETGEPACPRTVLSESYSGFIQHHPNPTGIRRVALFTGYTWRTTFWDSAMTAISVAGFQKELKYVPSYPWGRVLALLELLLTSTLIALFLLALRRQFKR